VNTRTTGLFLAALVVALSHASPPLHAQATTAPAVTGSDDKPWNRGVPLEARRAARELFLEGNRLFKIPLFARAAENYAAALRRWKHPAFYFNLALAQLNLGEEVLAHANLAQVLRDGEGSLGPEEFKEAQKQLRDLEHQIGRLRITCATPGAEIALDGAPLFVGPSQYEGWVKARAHEISARRADYLPVATRVVVAPGALATRDLALVKLSDAEVTRWAVWKPWAVVISGAVVGLASGGLHAFARAGFNRYDERFAQLSCVKDGCSEQDIGSDLNNQLAHARLEQQIAVGGYITGGALIATGALLLYLNRPYLVEQDPGAAGRQVVIAPSISAGAVGVLVTVSR